jgi:hypothetical protein
MALECATIKLPNGSVNGYHAAGAGAKDFVLEGLDELGLVPIAPPTSAGPVATEESTHKTAPQVQPRDKPRATPKPSSTKSPQTTPEKTASPKKQPAEHTQPVPSKVQYASQAELDAEQAKLERLSKAALAGDTTAIDKLRAALENCPHIWRRLGDLQYQVELKLIEFVAGNDPLRGEAFRKRCAELRHHLLEGESGSLATKMAASRVVACWMFTQFLELRSFESPHDLQCIKQFERAERRLQVAMRTFNNARKADLYLQQLKQNS